MIRRVRYERTLSPMFLAPHALPYYGPMIVARTSNQRAVFIASSRCLICRRIPTPLGAKDNLGSCEDSALARTICSWVSDSSVHSGIIRKIRHFLK